MMEFNFNTFFGYENYLNEERGLIVFGAFFLPIILSFVLSFIGFVFRKLRINAYSIYAIIYALLFTFLFGTFTILVLFFATDINGVKLAYCLFIIFIGMLFFSILNTNTITKMFKDIRNIK